MAGLYHYTTGAGLLGMLKDYSADNPNLTMRATHYMYMNDPKEYSYGQEICLDIIDEIEEELGINEDNRIKKIVTSDVFQEAYRCASRQVKGNIPYLISLSKAEDSLHMWNMYATNGNGIAIKFNEEKLRKSHYLKSCSYYQDKENSKNIYDKIKQEIIELYDQLNKNDKKKRTGIEKATYISSIICYVVGTRIKHIAYADEQEVRITPQVRVKDQEKFRDKNGLIVPYVDYTIPFDCVENILVGPTADFNRVSESILLLLNNKGIEWDEDKIIKSKVPYRL